MGSVNAVNASDASVASVDVARAKRQYTIASFTDALAGHFSSLYMLTTLNTIGCLDAAFRLLQEYPDQHIDFSRRYHGASVLCHFLRGVSFLLRFNAPRPQTRGLISSMRDHHHCGRSEMVMLIAREFVAREARAADAHKVNPLEIEERSSQEEWELKEPLLFLLLRRPVPYSELNALWLLRRMQPADMCSLRNAREETALQVLCRTGSAGGDQLATQLLELLVQAGLDPHQLTTGHSTLLHLAARSHSLVLFSTLLQRYGVSPVLLNDAGHNALDDLAGERNRDYEAIVRWIHDNIMQLSVEVCAALQHGSTDHGTGTLERLTLAFPSVPLAQRLHDQALPALHATLCEHLIPDVTGMVQQYLLAQVSDVELTSESA